MKMMVHDDVTLYALSRRTAAAELSAPLQKKKVSAKFKAHLHNDLVSADTLTLSDDPVHFTNAPKKSRGNTTLPMVVMENSITALNEQNRMVLLCYGFRHDQSMILDIF